MTGDRLVDRWSWSSFVEGVLTRPCVVKDPLGTAHRPNWWATPDPSTPEEDRGFDTWREAYDWLTKVVLRAE